MYLSELTVRNFRKFGQDGGGLTIRFNEGVTALVGQNDTGKSAVIDAIRYAFLTRDQEFIRIQPEDFHINAMGQQASEICIRCKLSALTADEHGAFVEYLSYEGKNVSLYINWAVRRLSETPGARRWIDVSVHSGIDGTGPELDSSVRALLSAAYLRPLRDAEREMSSGRGSRLSQILANVPKIRQGSAFDDNNPPANDEAVGALSLLGLSDYFSHNVNKHPGVGTAEKTINNRYLSSLSLEGDNLHGKISFSEGGTENARLMQILERLELRLFDGPSSAAKGRYGLGSNNLLFMACELLLLGNESDGLPLLLIEEPEAHLHPQRQLRLMEFLLTAANGKIVDSNRRVQVIVTTHSPNLASKVPLANMVLLEGQRAFSLAAGETKLEMGDYRFLERFLDVTKANLFFAHGVVIVEGDAEAILIPTIAKLIGCDFTVHGVSIVNVGGTGLCRFSRILQRQDGAQPPISIPVACIVDMDVMPNCAPQILGLVEDDNDQRWKNSKRKWRALRDFGNTPEEQEKKIEDRRTLLRVNDRQMVRTFVADHWTLEYDLAYSGLVDEIYVAASLAKNDDPLNEQKKQQADVDAEARKEFVALKQETSGNLEALCSRVYRLFKSKGASKTITAQYLAERLSKMVEGGALDQNGLRKRLPKYLVDAIDYVTTKPEATVPASADEGNADA